MKFSSNGYLSTRLAIKAQNCTSLREVVVNLLAKSDKQNLYIPVQLAAHTYSVGRYFFRKREVSNETANGTTPSNTEAKKLE